MKKTPKEIVDYYHKVMKDSFEKFGIVFDNFSGTSRPIHHENAKHFFLKLYENGFVSKKLKTSITVSIVKDFYLTGMLKEYVHIAKLREREGINVMLVENL